MNELHFSIPLTVFDADHFEQALKCSKSPVALLKKQIERTTDYMHQQYQQGTYIRDLISARAQFVDQLLKSSWPLFSLDADSDICLIAVGGYGRGELHPHSDIDLLILLKDEAAFERLQQKISGFVTLLWDTNLDIGHSVRTVSQCKNEAENDITIATNLMETRLLNGSDELYQTMIAESGPDKIWPSQTFFRAKWDEQIKRHQKHGNSEYVLEANVKNSPGGLRDIQMIGWIAKRHFDIKKIEELVNLGFLRKEEMDILNRGMDFMWRVRYALHMITGREEDRLLFDHQRTLAKMFGYEDDDAKTPFYSTVQLLEVESFAGLQTENR